MAFFRECPHCADYRAQRDQAQAAVTALLQQQQAIVSEVLTFKRHDIGLPPKGFEPTDPTSVLGPKTWAAIDEQAGGFPDLRARLINFAIGETQKAMKIDDESPDDADIMVAQRILTGDEG